MLDKVEAAGRLIKVVCGEPYGDGNTITDVGVGYAEPGYHDKETVWVLGDWNDKQRYVGLPDGGGEWMTTDRTPSRLLAALERIDVECEWLDEWMKCDHCYRIFRISGDSYMWKPFHVDFEDGNMLCGDCALDPEFLPDVLEVFTNDPHKRITFCEASVLESQGWVRYNEHPYESGWHEGMDADPRVVFAELEKEKPDHDVIFFKDESSQFYSTWSAFIKPKEVDEYECAN